MPTLHLMSGIEIAGAIIALGVAIFASAALRPKPKGAIADKDPSTLASRGEYVPLLHGTKRIGPLVGWVGDRSTTTEGGGGGKGASEEEAEITIYHEAAWHQLCVGPAKKISRIFQDGRVILGTPMTPGSTPSGSVVDLPNGEGQFRVFWGEINQPINTFLGDATRVTVSSRWPYLCYIEWNKKRLGQQTRWPILEYEVECEPQGVSSINGPGAAVSLGADGDGYNPIYSIESVLTMPYPHGIGVPKGELDYASMDAVAAQLANENMACGFLAQGGTTVEQVLTSYMADMGMFVTTLRGLVRFELVRPPALDQPILTEDVILPPLPEIDHVLRDKPANALTFTFADRAKNHRDMSIAVDEDGNASQIDSKQGRKIAIETTRNYVTAAAIADRRSQEELAQVSRFKILANRAARALWPGRTVVAAGIPFILRVTSLKPEALSGRVELDCLVDFYGAYTGFVPVPGASPAPAAIPSPAPGVSIAISPGHEDEFVATGIVAAAVGWIRPHVLCTGAEIHASLNGTTYQLLGVDTHRYWGGTLLDDLPPGDFFVEQGPRYTALGPDEGQALDLTADQAQWRLGRQALVINGELMYVRNLEALGAGVYRLRGVLRARYGTVQGDHATGDLAVMTRSTGAAVWRDAMFAPGATIRFKVRPLYGAGSVSLASITAVDWVVPRPIPYGPVGLRTDLIKGREGVYLFASGGAGIGGFTVRWSHVSVATTAARSGAGLQDAGEAVGSQPPMGTFDVQVLDVGDVVKIERLGVQAPQAFDGDTIDTAFGGMPVQLKVRVRETVAGFSTAWSTALTLDRITP